jgi:PPM family protein phosphatase
VWRRSGAEGGTARIATTVVALASPSGAAAVVAHVGDSPRYLLRNGRLELLTLDHTVVADLVRSGDLTRKRRAPIRTGTCSPGRSASGQAWTSTAQACTAPGGPAPAVQRRPVRTLSPQELEGALASGAEPRDAAGELVSSAVSKNAQDDVNTLDVDVH